MKSREDYISKNLSGLTDFIEPDEYCFYMDVISQMLEEYATECIKVDRRKLIEDDDIFYGISEWDNNVYEVDKDLIINSPINLI